MSTKMRGFTISDRDARNALSFDLRDILHLIGRRGLLSVWKLSGVEAVGADAADEIHLLSDSNAFVSGSRLTEISSRVSQIIDGEFQGAVDSQADPWIVIRAVDSSAFDVITSDESIWRKLKERFSEVSENSHLM